MMSLLLLGHKSVYGQTPKSLTEGQAVKTAVARAQAQLQEDSKDKIR